MSNFPYFIIEHIEEEFSKDFWCSIEYQNILRVVTPQRLIITNMSPEHQANLPEEFRSCAAITDKSLIDFLADASKADGNTALSGLSVSLPVSAETGESRICFLDEHGTGPLAPTDLPRFDYIIVGGILGDHPPRDRGGHLRGMGFAVRHLGPRQMSTDTAVLACATVLRHQTPIDALLYADDPEVYADEIDKVPVATAATTASVDESATKDSAAPATASGSGNGYRESTTIRMRYLLQQQPALGAAVPLDPALGLSEATGHWELSKPASQRGLSTASVNVPRMTPGLLEHVFDSADMEIDLGEFQIELGELESADPTEDRELLRELFPGEEI